MSVILIILIIILLKFNKAKELVRLALRTTKEGGK